jgi:hypothetical protein
MVTALTAVGALVFTGLSLQSTRDQLEIARTDQVTQRFTTAVEHLGDDRTTDVRLGAVLALERIARDSAVDREAVGQLLAAFVRRRRPLGETCVQDQGDQADVDAALRVVSTERLVAAPDLRATCLSGLDLSGARLRCATLAGADLTGTTKLMGADLRQADLTGAVLSGTDPADASPPAANLNGADLEGARLTGADLSHTFLIGADLRGAELTAAMLTGVMLGRADLRGAHLLGTDLSDADLSGVKWAGAHIGDSTFSSPAAKADAIAGGAIDDFGQFREPPCTP